MKVFSKKEIEKIAKELFDEGFNYSEAVPIKMWKLKELPETEEFFKLIDCYINYLKLFELYCPKK